MKEYDVSVYLHGKPHRLVTLMAETEGAAIRRAVTNVWIQDLKQGNPNEVCHYTGELYEGDKGQSYIGGCVV